MQQFTSLFLSQSYKDTWEDYKRSLHNSKFTCWDYVILTASNEKQAEGFRMQLEERMRSGFLPSHTHFAVIPDPEGKRVGSGGATLGVIRYITEQTGTSDFSGLRILVIHSGGDSKRVPQYSALGKLFSPVPHELPNGRASTLFDEFIIAMSSVPSRIREGMLLLSGDVLLLFNPLQIDFSGRGAAAISFKENVEIGKNHGVFLRDEEGNVAKFLHKQTVEALNACGAVNERNCVDIDTGAIIFSREILSALYGLISTEHIFDERKYQRFVNETVRLSLYGDFLYPLANDSTLEKFYLEKPEGTYCEELKEARRKVWETLRPYHMKLLRLAPAKFIHFGTTREILKMMDSGIATYRNLGWKEQICSSMREGVSGYNSIASAQAKIGNGCYLEVSYVHHDAVVGEHALLSYVDIHDEVIPSNIVLHGLKQRDGKFVVRIYGTQDNPKGLLEDNCTFLTGTLETFMQKNSISAKELWDVEEHSLWNANLYPVCNTITEAVAAALNIYHMAEGEGNIDLWKQKERKSLCSGFHDADSQAIIAWDKRMAELVCMARISQLIHSKESVIKAKEILKGKMLTKIQREWLQKHLMRAEFGEKIRLNYYVGKAIDESEGTVYLTDCFKSISKTILENSLDSLQYNTKCKIVSEKHTVSLPLRVNFGGGWSDTPPYCIEHGGTVLNVAILLNGKRPVEVTLERISELKVVFDSRDMNVHGEFEKIEPLQKTGDPYDSFALQKACLLACGIIPRTGGDLGEILQRLGGGFLMRSEVTGVPQGSGLGTSSILSAACVKAVFEFMGIPYSEDELYSHVLCMEQIMSTGGGWQDQVGGITDGFKYITTMPGLKQKINVQHIKLPNEVMQKLNSRFALIYTGQRRLARNLLRDVVGRYIGNDSQAVYALNEIQKVATLMRFELERGHIDDFAELLNYHWELSKQIDAGSTNTLIDQIFKSIDDLICGKMICGAGGGGFLQVILKDGITHEDIHIRLKDVFQDNDVDVWKCTLT